MSLNVYETRCTDHRCKQYTSRIGISSSTLPAHLFGSHIATVPSWALRLAIINDADH